MGLTIHKLSLTPCIIDLVTAENTSSVGLQASYDSHCVCPGDNAFYECIVPGGGLTVWTGEAFNCSGTNNEIQLLHGINSTRECNNGSIKGSLSSTQSNESLYTSQLTVTVGPDTNGTTIECIHDDGAGNRNKTGSTVLNITTGIYYSCVIKLS